MNTKVSKTDYNSEFKQKIKNDWELMKVIEQAEKEEEAAMKKNLYCCKK